MHSSTLSWDFFSNLGIFKKSLEQHCLTELLYIVNVMMFTANMRPIYMCKDGACLYAMAVSCLSVCLSVCLSPMRTDGSWGLPCQLH